MNPWRSIKGLPREVWILAVASLINRAGTMVVPFLVLYLTRALHFEPATASFVLTVFGLGAFLVSQPAGRISDRIGRLPVMTASLVGGGLVLIVFPFAKSLPMV